MPNWITGSLKVRGSYENVKKFFMEGLNEYRSEFDKSSNSYEERVVPKEEWLLETRESEEQWGKEFSMHIKFGEWVYVEGTKRAFITSDYISFYESSEGSQVVAACEINQAWSFKEEDWVDISKKYNVDIRLYGFEQGMEFSQEIEIINGSVVRNATIKYSDWEWDCPFPWLGG